MQHFKFKELIKDLLTKINHENNKSITGRDFNLQLLKYTQISGIHDFLECLLHKNYLPQITLPTQAVQKTVSLIDKISTNNDKDGCYSRNLRTSLSIIFQNFQPLKTFMTELLLLPVTS